jgi:lipoic acid synthetase
MKNSPALPAWFKKKTAKSVFQKNFRLALANPFIHTVCEEALCPNRGECLAAGRTAFLIMGNICTRHCTFCAVAQGRPAPLDKQEPERIGAAVAKLQLKYVVITSVTRDDLPDGGAAHFAATVKAIKKENPQTKVEVLTPDFQGNLGSLKTVLDSGPFVFNHNLETVPRLYPMVRPQADYQRSLAILVATKKIAPKIFTKSGLMLGLGETITEVKTVMEDLSQTGCDFLTFGQYLQPTAHHAKIRQYILPEIFKKLEILGKKIGFKKVFSGPWVRSSYMADKLLQFEHSEN